MVDSFDIEFVDGESGTWNAKGFQMFKRDIGLEVIFKDEETLEYRVTLHPWHTIKTFTSNGTLERPNK